MRKGPLSPALALAIALGSWALFQGVRLVHELARAPPHAGLPAPLVPDINSAPLRHLLLLPGVGPARASAIVEDRGRAGPFQDLDDLQRVRGIGPVTAAGLRGFARVAADR